MSISTNIEMSKVYAGEAQIGEIYRGSELMYKAELVVFDGESLAEGYTYTSYGHNSTTHGLFYAKSRYNDAGGHREQACCFVPIDCTGFSKITVTYSAVHSSYSVVQIGLCNVAGDANRFYTTSIRENSVWNIYNDDVDTSPKSDTVSFDISNITGIKYLAVATENTQGNQTDAVITRVVLE